MDGNRVEDEFARINLTDQLARDRAIIAQYEEGLACRRKEVEDARYELGMLDERLGGRR